MVCRVQNEYGRIEIQEEVIAIIAGNAAMECYGIVAMVSKRAKDNFVEMLGRDNPSRGIVIRIDEDTVHIHLYVMVEYGVSIAAVAQSAMETIKYKLETATGIRVGSVNITVEGIRV